MDRSTYTWLDRDTGETKSIRLLGHRLLVRRCERDQSEFFVGTPKPGEVPRLAELVVEAMTTAGWCHWCEVLAVGPDVGKKRTPAQMLKFKCRKVHGDDPDFQIPIHVEAGDLSVGDLVILPEGSMYRNTRFRGVTGKEYDSIVDVCNVIAYWKAAENNP